MANISKIKVNGTTYDVNDSKVSNPNLLDNPWFTVNQRGSTGANNGGYAVDRWYGNYNVSNGRIVLAKGNYFVEKFEEPFKDFLNGKTVTASILFSDGRIESGTLVYQKAPSQEIRFFERTVYICLLQNDGAFGVNCLSQNGCTVVAVKLELGAKSTLANDTAPNYATELLKCQRYYQKLSGINYVQWCSDSFVRASVPFVTTMRTAPSVLSYTSQNGWNYATVITSTELVYFAGQSGQVWGDTLTYIVLSAEL